MKKSTLVALVAVVLVVGLGGGMVAGQALATRSTAQPGSAQCGSASQSQVRTTLYFGMSRPKGAVSELEWQLFLRDEVTPLFPAGLTVWDAQGQWRLQAGTIEQERSKVLLLVHSESAAASASVQTVIAKYRKAFDQESVLWETARVCIAN